MDWDIWDSIFLWSPNNVLIACVSEKNCRERDMNMAVPCEHVQVLLSAWSAVHAAISQVELCEMLIAATRENWHEICTQGTVIFVPVSVRTTFT